MGLNIGHTKCPKCKHKEDAPDMKVNPGLCPECGTQMHSYFLRAGVVFFNNGEIPNE